MHDQNECSEEAPRTAVHGLALLVRRAGAKSYNAVLPVTVFKVSVVFGASGHLCCRRDGPDHVAMLQIVAAPDTEFLLQIPHASQTCNSWKDIFHVDDLASMACSSSVPHAYIYRQARAHAASPFCRAGPAMDDKASCTR
jgi:hypothetical protein